MPSFSPRALLVGSALICLIYQPVFAQAIPGQAQPGREQDGLDEPLGGDGFMSPEILAPSALLTVPENAQDITFELRDVQVDGMTAFTTEELSPLYANMLESTVTLADIYTLANRITAFYRQHGYLISQAVVPPQDIDAGNVRIRVVEGFVERVDFRTAEGVLLNQMTLDQVAAKIVGSRPLDQRVLERQMLLLNDFAGVEAKAIVAPSEQVAGATHLTIEVLQRKYEGEVQVDNRGSRYLGPVQIQAKGVVNGFLGDYDKLDVLLAGSGDLHELKLVEARHTVPLGGNGMTASLQGSYSRSAPGYNLEAFDVKGKNLLIEGLVHYPLMRGRKTNLELYGGFAWQDLQTTSLGAKISDETITTAKIGAKFDHIDGWNGRDALTFEAVQGVSALGASHKGDALLSRAAAEPQFTKLAIEASREQFFAGSRFSVVTAVRGQYTRASLVASQEFGVGGSAFGRGYDPSEITGDSGIAAKVEARFTATPTDTRMIKTFQPYAFYDTGITADNKGSGGRATLSSVGGGMRFALAGKTTAELELAKPVGRNTTATGDKDMRVFVGLSKAF